jgi:hypothetical protein
MPESADLLADREQSAAREGLGRIEYLSRDMVLDIILAMLLLREL